MSEQFDDIMSLPVPPSGALDGTEVFEAVSQKLGQTGGYPNVRLSILQIANWIGAFLGLAPKPINTQAGVNYTAVAADVARWTDFTSNVGVAFQIDGNVAYGSDVEIEFSQSGTGIVTVSGVNGAVIQSRGGIVTTAGQFAVAMLKRKGNTNNWLLTGDVA